MIKEWIRSFCGYDLLKDICDDIRHDIAELFGAVYEIDGNKKISKLHKLTDTCNKADRTNEEAIKFLLKHIKVDKKFFNEYKYTPYKDLPWYLQEIFNNLYKVDKVIYYSGKIAIASSLTGIIATDSACIGKIIEVTNELSNK
jgi:2-hydroxy-3-keto-5-methylthiopentenyl-1-phosphate phosphatase